MGRSTRYLLVVVALVMGLTVSTAAVAGETQTPPPSELPKSTPPTGEEQKTPPQSDVRALSPDEVDAYQTASDSLAQTEQLQEMNVGHGIDGTVVLSVLVALVIFAVLVAIL